MPIIDARERPRPKPVTIFKRQFGFNREVSPFAPTKDGCRAFALDDLFLEPADGTNNGFHVTSVRLRNKNKVKPQLVTRQVIHVSDIVNFAVPCQDGICHTLELPPLTPKPVHPGGQNPLSQFGLCFTSLHVRR